MRAVKENREYTITATDAPRFLKRGYDVYDDKNKLVERGHGKTVPWAKFEALQAENKELKAKIREAGKDKPGG